VESRVKSDAQADSETDAGGLGADGESDSDTRIGATNTSGGNATNGTDNTSEGNAVSRTTIGNGADLLGTTVTVAAYVDKMRAHAFAETDVTAVGADADAYADPCASGINEVRRLNGSEITGNEKIPRRRDQRRLDQRAIGQRPRRGWRRHRQFLEARLNNRSKVEGSTTRCCGPQSSWSTRCRTAPWATPRAARDGAVFDGGSSASPETNNALRDLLGSDHQDARRAQPRARGRCDRHDHQDDERHPATGETLARRSPALRSSSITSSMTSRRR
jgi:hypothetical protein